MDELVAVGTAGLIGLVLTGILILAGAWWIVTVLWSAYSSGQWQGVTEFFIALALLAAGYAAIGVWLQKSGHI